MAITGEQDFGTTTAESPRYTAVAAAASDNTAASTPALPVHACHRLPLGPAGVAHVGPQSVVGHTGGGAAVGVLTAEQPPGAERTRRATREGVSTSAYDSRAISGRSSNPVTSVADTTATARNPTVYRASVQAPSSPVTGTSQAARQQQAERRSGQSAGTSAHHRRPWIVGRRGRGATPLLGDLIAGSVDELAARWSSPLVRVAPAWMRPP
jgi:hypothetical protein